MIEFMPVSEPGEIVQNIRTILATTRGDVPLDRAFGMRGWALDAPLPAAEGLLTRDIVEAVTTYEPRAKIIRVECTAEELLGRLTAKVIFGIPGYDGEFEVTSSGTNELPPEPAPVGMGERYVRIAAEFAGGGLWWDPTSEFGHSGVMTFDGETHAYSWTTLNEAAPQEYCVRVRFGVPAGFASWRNCRFWGKISEGAGEGTVVMLTGVYDTTGVQVGIDAVEISASEWTAAEFEMPAGTYEEGGFVTLVFCLRAAAKAGAVQSYAYLGDLELDAW